MFDNTSVKATNDTANPVDIPITSAVVVLVIGILSAVFNGLLILVMTLNSKQIFASLGSYFIMNLAIADFITGLNSIYWGLEAIARFNPPILNTILLRVFWITVQVSFYTIFIMSTERLIAIVFPFRAALLLSRRKTIVYCVVVWLIAFIPAATDATQKQLDAIWFSIIVVFEVVILVIVVEYVFVFRQLRALWLHSKTRVVYTHNSKSAICSPDRQTTDVQREYQVTLVVICLAIVLVVTVFPYNIVTQIYIACNFFNCPITVNESMETFMWHYFPVELLNFLVNPIVYAWRLPKYRKAFLVTFRLQKQDESLYPQTMQSNISPNGTATKHLLKC